MGCQSYIQYLYFLRRKRRHRPHPYLECHQSRRSLYPTATVVPLEILFYWTDPLVYPGQFESAEIPTVAPSKVRFGTITPSNGLLIGNFRAKAIAIAKAESKGVLRYFLALYQEYRKKKQGNQKVFFHKIILFKSRAKNSPLIMESQTIKLKLVAKIVYP